MCRLQKTDVGAFQESPLERAGNKRKWKNVGAGLCACPNKWMKKIMVRSKLIVCYILCLIVISSVSAAKTDIVILKNGDFITGEVKGMEFARLSYSTDAMKTLSIEWDEVKYLKAKETFRIEMEDETDFSGALDSDSLNLTLIIKFKNYSYNVKFNQVVKITPIKDTFLERVNFSVDLGFSYTKASEVAQLTSNANGNYRSWEFYHELDFNSIVTTTSDTNTTENIDLRWNSSRFFLYKWFLNSFVGAQRNTELGLDLRLLIGAGGGKDIFRTNTNLLSGAGGLQVTQEWDRGTAGSSTSLEGIINVRHKKFQYNDPEIDWTTTIQVYPSFTTWGRIRVNFNTNLKWEIYKDLFWRLTFYDNYDSQPPSEGAANNDYGITLSFGWKY
jgi:hypothetical protein